MQGSPFCNANSQDICLLSSFLKMPFDVEGEMARGDVLRETAVHGKEGEGVGAGVREVCAAHGQRHAAFELRFD